MDKRIFLTLVLLLGAMFILKDVKDAHRYKVLANGARAVRIQNQRADALPGAGMYAVETPIVHASFRPLNFALLRGGFSSVDEFFERVHDDPVLHAFYGDCADRSASMHALSENLAAFTTFRKGDKIKWAQRPLVIKKGEYVMTFCGKSVLARCGNLISVAPMQPSEDVPPALLEAPSEQPDAPLTLVAAAAPAPVIPGAAPVVPAVVAAHHGFFFIPPFYIPPGGSHSSAPPSAGIVPPPTTGTPPPATGGGGTPPPVGPPPPITGAPPPPPSGPPAPPAGHISGDEFSGHQKLLTLLVGMVVIALLKLTTR